MVRSTHEPRIRFYKLSYSSNHLSSFKYSIGNVGADGNIRDLLFLKTRQNIITHCQSFYIRFDNWRGHADIGTVGPLREDTLAIMT